MSNSPMMRQYQDAKQACGDALLFFRMGDFYELFYEDAKIVAREIGLTLTSRDKNENPIPMAGFPHHQLDGYLAKLIRKGFRVAVCEQMEDPREAKGIVKREITRIVTPGTLTDDALLDPRTSNLLACVYSPQPGKLAVAEDKDLVGIAWCELSTGRFEAGIFPRRSLMDELARLEPSEILLRDDDGVLSKNALDTWALTTRPVWQFGIDEATRQLRQHFEVHSLDGMGWELPADNLALSSAGAILAYLEETQKSSLGHIRSVVPYRTGRTLEIDGATRRSLELTHTIRSGQREGSLLSVLDQTVTPMGARLIAGWLAEPLVDGGQISLRLEAVEELLTSQKLRNSVRSIFSEVYDIQRLLGRIATGRASPRDLQQVGGTLRLLPKLKLLLDGCTSQRLRQLNSNLVLLEELRDRLTHALAEDCPLVSREGGFIRDGYHPRLDELRELATGGKQWIARYQAEQIEQTGITSLRVGFTKVFGYYLEVTHTHRDRIPPHFHRKQTLKNAERYITDELKQYETKVLSADEESQALEYELFVELRDAVAARLVQLQQIAQVIAELDVFAGLAELARKQNYVRPEIVANDELEIVEGRHPVLDFNLPQGTFVPNDCLAGGPHGKVFLITGPNMAGKSTYIRQTALLTLMAQLGSFLPARRAKIGVADRIFARVGASDELARGQSTFMVEMVETARILNTATSRSLIILDEIGRGTSTYDGLSLAWAIVEHIHDAIGARTLFATHYHELTQLQKSLPQVRNLNVAVNEWDEKIVFLHRIVPGGADKSYGIHVARLAGIPSTINERAKDILAQLEMDHVNRYGDSKITPPRRKEKSAIQLTLFDFGEHPVVETIRSLDVGSTTPVQALQILEQLQREAQRKN